MSDAIRTGDRLEDPDRAVWTVVAADQEQGLYVLERQVTERRVAAADEIGERGRRYRPVKG